MADVIREAVIKLTLAPEQVKFTGADASGLKKGYEEVAVAAERAAEREAQAARDAAAVAVAEANAHAEASKVKVAEINAAAEAAQLAAKKEAEAAKAAADAAKEAAREAEKAAEDKAKAQEDAAKKAADAQKKLTDLNQAAIEPLMAVGESAMRAGRGLVFLVAANEETALAMAKMMAVAQGIVDVFSGSLGLYKNITQLQRLYAESTKAATEAQAALAAANSATALSMTGALIPALMRGNTLLQGTAINLLRIVGPAGLVIGTLAALKLWWDRSEESVRKLTEAEQKWIDTQNKLASMRQSVRDIGRSGALAGISATSDPTQRIAEIGRQLDAVAKAREETEKGLALEIELQQTRGAGEQVTLEKHLEMIQLGEQEKALREAQLSAEQERTRAQQDQIQNQIQLIENAQKELELAERAAQAEQDRQRSAQAQLGLLDEAQKRRLIALDQRDISSLRTSELRELSQLGGERFRSEVEAEAARRGREFERNLQQDAFQDERRRQQEIDSQLADARQGLSGLGANDPAQAIASLHAQNEAIAAAAKEGQQQLEAVIREIIVSLTDRKREIQEIRMGAL